VSCHGFFPTGHKEFGSLLITDSTLPPACGEDSQEKWTKAFRTQIMNQQGYGSLQTNKVSMNNPDVHMLKIIQTPWVQTSPKGKK
jgi:hypothetical protein